MAQQGRKKSIDSRYSEIGERIRKARKNADNMSAEDLAALIGTNQQTVSAWENATQAISVHSLLDISKALQVSTDWLLFGEGPMSRNMTMRDCCEMLYKTMPACFDWRWSVSWTCHNSPLNGQYEADGIPQIQFTMSLPTELEYNFDFTSEIEYPTGHSSIAPDFQPLAELAEIAGVAQQTLRRAPWLIDDDAFNTALLSVPDIPIASFKTASFTPLSDDDITVYKP